MKKTAHTILLVDDDVGIAFLQRRALERADFRVLTAATVAEAFSALAGDTIDLIVLDYCLSHDHTGLDFFQELRAAGYDVPAILVTGNSDESIVIRALRAGIRDYVTKSSDYLQYLPHAIKRVVAQVELENRLAESEARFQLFMDHSPAIAFIKDSDGRMIFANRSCQQLLPIKDWQGKTDAELWPQDIGAKLRANDCQVLASGRPMEVIEEFAAPDGDQRCFVSYKFPMCDEFGERLLGGMAIDITDRRKAEEQLRQRNEQLRQSQKLEALGTLAGGVAHEFNNLLQAITGYTGFALDGLSTNDQRYQDLQQVLTASRRATSLTHELLSFSRRNVFETTDVDSNQLVLDLVKMLKPLIGASIDIRLQLSKDPIIVRADGGQLEQMLLNLCINARDAMPDGGELCISTEEVVFSDLYCAHHANTSPGRFLMFSVADTGVGIPADTKQRIFEPFFTTKEVGKGTGLGLAMVYGVVQQHQGTIEVYSEVGTGTTFKVYLPALASSEPTGLAAAPMLCRGGAELILVAEDEPLIRELVCRILTQAGYRTLLASDGEDALGIFLEHSDDIALALLDVVMPKRGGREVYYRMKQAKPDLRAVFCSGFSPDTAQLDPGLDKDVRLLQKPVDPCTLLNTIREVLDGEVACLKP